MVIGKVIATEAHPTTIDEFYFWTKTDLIISPFDVVKVTHINGSFTYGIVKEIAHITDSAGFLSNFISSDFGNLEATSNTERIGMNYVKASVIYNSDDIYTPVLNGPDVSLATRKDVEIALGLEELKSGEYITCGSIEMYEKMGSQYKLKIPVKLNTRFLLGPDGAHLNISGISGLASKTSYTMFLIKSIQEHYLKKAQKNSKEKIAFVVLNVKGADLLAIDKSREYKSDEHKKQVEEKYCDLGLSSEPVKNVKYFYPYSGKEIPTSFITKDIFQDQIASKQAVTFKYLYKEDKARINLLFSDIDDPNQTMESILNTISSDKEFEDLDSWEDFLVKLDKHTQAQQGGVSKDIQIASWKKFKRIIRKNIENNPLFAQRAVATQKEVRLRDSISKIQANDIFVIDIAKMDGVLQSFVFGDVIKAVSDLIQGQYDDTWTIKNPPDKVVIFVDELNKYAASDISNSPLLDQIRDVAERGRSLGIILFSAEQFKSAVNSKVTGNCSTHAYGRTNSVELSHPSYKFIPSGDKAIMTRLRQGEYIIQNPILKTLLKIRFPEPVYFQFE